MGELSLPIVSSTPRTAVLVPQLIISQYLPSTIAQRAEVTSEALRKFSNSLNSQETNSLRVPNMRPYKAEFLESQTLETLKAYKLSWDRTLRGVATHKDPKNEASIEIGHIAEINLRRIEAAITGKEGRQTVALEVSRKQLLRAEQSRAKDIFRMDVADPRTRNECRRNWRKLIKLGVSQEELRSLSKFAERFGVNPWQDFSIVDQQDVGGSPPSLPSAVKPWQTITPDLSHEKKLWDQSPPPKVSNEGNNITLTAFPAGASRARDNLIEGVNPGNFESDNWNSPYLSNSTTSSGRDYTREAHVEAKLKQMERAGLLKRRGQLLTITVNPQDVSKLGLPSDLPSEYYFMGGSARAILLQALGESRPTGKIRDIDLLRFGTDITDRDNQFAKQHSFEDWSNGHGVSLSRNLGEYLGTRDFLMNQVCANNRTIYATTDAVKDILLGRLTIAKNERNSRFVDKLVTKAFRLKAQAIEEGGDLHVNIPQGIELAPFHVALHLDRAREHGYATSLQYLGLINEYTGGAYQDMSLEDVLRELTPNLPNQERFFRHFSERELRQIFRDSAVNEDMDLPTQPYEEFDILWPRQLGMGREYQLGE